MTPPLDQQRIVVTGAAMGLGAAIARHLSAQGAHLVLIDRDATRLRDTAALCPGAEAITADLADLAQTQRAALPTWPANP